MNENDIKSKEIFISYQTADKAVAGKIKKILSDYGMVSFLAHEDIEISIG
jgi:adenine-specific DNA methylase